MFFFDPEGGFMAVVECKESLVGFNDNTFVQAQDYLIDHHVRFLVTDGMTFISLIRFGQTSSERNNKPFNCCLAEVRYG